MEPGAGLVTRRAVLRDGFAAHNPSPVTGRCVTDAPTFVQVVTGVTGVLDIGPVTGDRFPPIDPHTRGRTHTGERTSRNLSSVTAGGAR